MVGIQKVRWGWFGKDQKRVGIEIEKWVGRWGEKKGKGR